MVCDNFIWLIVVVIIIIVILFILKVSKESKILQKQLEIEYSKNKYSKRSLPKKTQKILGNHSIDSLIEDYFIKRELSVYVYLRFLVFEFDNFGIESLYWNDPEKANAFKDQYGFFGLVTLDEYYYIKGILERIDNEVEKKKQR